MLNLYHTVNLPVWAICPLANDDFSALNSEDAQQILEFVKEYPLSEFHYDLTEDKESSFCHYPEFGLSADCIELDIYIYTFKAFA